MIYVPWPPSRIWLLSIKQTDNEIIEKMLLSIGVCLLQGLGKELEKCVAVAQHQLIK